jgi:glycosyltransferase involved in cell wall biosynthesis
VKTLVAAQPRPLVSVVMAAFNAARFVGDALASLSGQTLPDLEVLVVDDGSTDATAEQVRLAARRDPRIRLLRLGRNRGQAAALNAGIGEARGRYLAILDADDEATPGRLADQVAAFEREPGLVLVGGAVSTWSEEHGAETGTWRYQREDASIRVRSLFKSEFISGAMTLDRDLVERHRLRFDERLRLGADWALSHQAMRVGRVANLPSIVMRYRVHPGQLTSGMMDDLRSDSALIRSEALAWAGIRPTQDELRTHLAVSPCNYWAFGTHPYFRARRASIREETARWFERLRRETARAGRLSPEALGAWLDDIAARIAVCLDEQPLAEARR